VLFTFSAYCSVSESAPVPFFVWSNNDFFLGQNQIMAEISSSNAQSLLQSCCFVQNSQESSFSRYFKKDVRTTPEVVILFLEQKMSTEQFAELSSVYHRKPSTNSAFLNLASRIEKAKSNLLVPLVRVEGTEKLSDSLSQMTLSLAKLYPSSSSLLVKSSSSSFLSNLVSKITTKTPEQFLEFLQKETTIFSNGVPDLIIIPFDSPTFYEHDAYMEKVQKVVDEKTSGNFISIYTADSPKASHALRSFTVEQINTISAVSEVAQAALYSSNADPYNVGVYTSYFPIQIFEIILVAFFSIGTILVGGLCLFGTQTPQRYETPKKQKSELM
jgi:hypothetical protein